MESIFSLSKGQQGGEYGRDDRWKEGHGEPGLPWELCPQLSAIRDVLVLLLHTYLLQNTLGFEQNLLVIHLPLLVEDRYYCMLGLPHLI